MKSISTQPIPSVLRSEISIVDDGDVEYGFAQPSYSVTEGSSVSVTVTKSTNSAAQATIAYSVSSASLGYAPSSAYQPITGTLVFGSTDMSKSFTVQTIDNAVYSDDQSIPLQLSIVSSSGSGSVSLSSTARTTLVTIQDDGDAGRIEIDQISLVLQLFHSLSSSIFCTDLEIDRTISRIILGAKGTSLREIRR